jgi:hypothetical protein
VEIGLREEVLRDFGDIIGVEFTGCEAIREEIIRFGLLLADYLALSERICTLIFVFSCIFPIFNPIKGVKSARNARISALETAKQ